MKVVDEVCGTMGSDYKKQQNKVLRGLVIYGGIFPVCGEGFVEWLSGTYPQASFSVDDFEGDLGHRVRAVCCVAPPEYPRVTYAPAPGDAVDLGLLRVHDGGLFPELGWPEHVATAWMYARGQLD